MRNCTGIYGLLMIVLCACDGKDFPEIGQCNNPPKLQLSDVRHPLSCTVADGRIEVITAGGAGDLQFTRNGQNSQPSGSFHDLSPGYHIIIVTDSKGCSDTLSVELLNAVSSLSASAVTQANTECLAFNGSAFVSASNGVPPYQFSFAKGPFTNIQQFENLPSGIFSISVKDADGCIIELAAQVLRGNTGVSWSDDIEPVILTRCAKAGCHDGYSGRPALNSFAQVYELRNQIRSRIASGSMPFDGPLPADQKAEILCWLDDGALNN